MEDRVLHRELSYTLVNSAIEVWQTLGYGFLEKVYENLLAIDFS